MSFMEEPFAKRTCTASQSQPVEPFAKRTCTESPDLFSPPDICMSEEEEEEGMWVDQDLVEELPTTTSNHTKNLRDHPYSRPRLNKELRMAH
jgi:hypothetical protein